MPGLHLAVVGPLGGEDLLVAGELGGPAQVEAGHDHGQVVRLDHLVVGSNLGHLQTRGYDVSDQSVLWKIWNVWSEADLVLKRTHLLLLTLNPLCSLALLDLQTLRHLEEVRHVGVVPAQQDAPVLAGQRVQVDKVGDDVGHEEGVTGSL